MARRRSSTGVTDFLSDVTDDIKDFVDDDILDRGRDTERDLRRAARTLTRDERDDRRSRRRDGGRRDSGRRGSGNRADELAELRRAVRTLAAKVGELADSGTGSKPAGATSGSELPITGYDDMTVVQISDKLGSLTQAELEAIDKHERAHANRSTVTSRIDVLRGSEPWPGYDEETVVEIRKKLTDADPDTLKEVRGYETRHKNRQGVLDAASDS